MKNRRAFLASLAASSAALSVAAADPAQAQSSPSPVPSASAKPATAASLAIAATFRRFDGSLTGDELETIAKAIDANNDAAKALNPKKKRLKNGDAPAVRFGVAGGDA